VLAQAQGECAKGDQQNRQGQRDADPEVTARRYVDLLA
jgi:hypothetical protein